MEGGSDELETNPFETTASSEPTSVFESTSVFETNTAAAPPTITLSGSVSEFQTVNFDTIPVPEKGKMQWKQFFFGLFIPYIAAFLFVAIGVFAEEIGDPSLYSEKTLTVDENGYFIHNFQQSRDIELEWCYEEMYPRLIDIRCDFDYANSSGNTIVLERIEDPGQSSTHTVIGEYTSSNSTLWFQPTDSSIESITLSMDFYDPSKDSEFVFEVLSIGACFSPFIYIGAVIFAFVKQKHSFAYGLLSALGLWIAMIAFFIASLLMWGF